MTHEAIETGPLGRPVDMYEFAQAGVFTRVTSAATAQSAAGQTYTPLEFLSHTEPRQTTEANSGEIEVTCPSNFEIAAQFRAGIPTALPSLTIFQKHLNDGDDQVVTYWKGIVVSCTANDGRKASLRCLPPTHLFTRPMPRVVYSGLCNHQLFDAGCTVVASQFAATGLIITGLDTLRTTITIPGLRDAAAARQAAHSTSLTSDELDHYWTRGYIATGLSPQEYRMVVESNIGDPDVVRINWPFALAEVGTPVEVFAGCNHALDLVTGHCQRKFVNGINFGGYPYVPTNNPFSIELDSGRSDQPAPTWRGFRIR